MRAKSPAEPDLTMEEIMRLWPTTVGVILRYNMLCVGCPIAGFHTTKDACGEHDVEPEAFVSDLLKAAD